MRFCEFLGKCDEMSMVIYINKKGVNVWTIDVPSVYMDGNMLIPNWMLNMYVDYIGLNYDEDEHLPFLDVVLK